MKKLSIGIILLAGSLSLPPGNAKGEVSLSIGTRNLSVGINIPTYPELAPVPGYPVYYAPRLSSNYFFYDGMYWVYENENWYASYWYNGPWSYVQPEIVPLYILRVPVRYYRHPPSYFRGWASNAPPRWDQHWGRGWEEKRRGWKDWNKGSHPVRAPLPQYQRQYAGDRYPHLEQQRQLHDSNYSYRPQNRAVHERIRQNYGKGNDNSRNNPGGYSGAPRNPGQRDISDRQGGGGGRGEAGNGQHGDKWQGGNEHRGRGN